MIRKYFIVIRLRPDTPLIRITKANFKETKKPKKNKKNPTKHYLRIIKKKNKKKKTLHIKVSLATYLVILYPSWPGVSLWLSVYFSPFSRADQEWKAEIIKLLYDLRIVLVKRTSDGYTVRRINTGFIIFASLINGRQVYKNLLSYKPTLSLSTVIFLGRLSLDKEANKIIKNVSHCNKSTTWGALVTMEKHFS